LLCRAVITKFHNKIFLKKKQHSKFVTHNFSFRIENSQIDALIKQADVNGDGFIDYEEFSRMMMN
jgi:Ca2+-binding EF-hand superfamily protein